MKIITILLATFIAFSLVSGQSTNQSKSIGIYFPILAKNQVVNKESTEGSPSYQGKGYYSFGLNYLYSTCSCSAYEIGIEYSCYSFTIIPGVDQLNNPSYNSKLSVLSIPLSLRLNFFKYFYLNAGVFLDFDFSNQSSISNQTGFGANFGLGIKYDFKSGIGIYANPFYKSHSWVSFAMGNNKQRLYDSGIKIGLSYRF